MSIENDRNLNQMAETEDRLINACRSRTLGWESELVTWVNGNGGWLERRCAARLGSKFDAQDVVQEITIKVLRSIDQFEGRSSLRTWVTRIGDNQCSTFMKQRTAKAMTDHLQFNIELFENARCEQPEHDLGDETRVAVTLNALAEKNCEILKMRFFSELSIDEIASSLELSLSATKMRLYRAMDAFKKKYSIDPI